MDNLAKAIRKAYLEFMFPTEQYSDEDLESGPEVTKRLFEHIARRVREHLELDLVQQMALINIHDDDD